MKPVPWKVLLCLSGIATTGCQGVAKVTSGHADAGRATLCQSDSSPAVNTPQNTPWSTRRSVLDLTGSEGEVETKELIDKGNARLIRYEDVEGTLATDMSKSDLGSHNESESAGRSTSQGPIAALPISAVPPSPGTLETDPSVDHPLTLDELQQIAVANNPTLKQAYGFVQQARGNWWQVGLYPNPVIEAQQGANNAPLDMFNTFVSQDIVTGSKLKLNREVASFDIDRAQWEAEAQNLRVLNDVRIRYVAALSAQRQVEVAEELLRISEEGVRVTEQLRAGEQVSEADVLQARLQLNQTQIILRNAQFRVVAAWKQLGNVIGSPNMPVRPLAGELNEDVPEIEWDTVWSEILGGNPLMHAARSRLHAAQMQVIREERQVKPNLQLRTGLGRDFFNPQYMMYTLQMGITLPTFNRNQGNIAAADADWRAAQAELNRIELSLRDELAKAFQRYQVAGNQVEAYRDEILPIAEQNLKLTLKRYEEGEFDLLRVLTARRDLFDARIEYVRAYTDWRIAAIEIKGLLLTGGLDAVESKPTASNRAGQTNSSGN